MKPAFAPLSILALSLALSAALMVQSPAAAQSGDWRTPDPDNVLVIDTNKGRIIVEMSPVLAPGHVPRIRELARARFYDGLKFFRVVDAFMAQTGDPLNTGEGGSDKPDLKAEFTFLRDAATPFVPVVAEGGPEAGFIGPMPVISQNSDFMLMSVDGRARAFGYFCPGVAGMARAGDPDSANSQFFLMRQPYPTLNQAYTPWGRVLSGQDVVRRLKVGEPVAQPQDQMERVRLLADIPAAERPVVQVMDTASAAFRALAQKVRTERGAQFSLCDIEIPVQVR